MSHIDFFSGNIALFKRLNIESPDEGVVPVDFIKIPFFPVKMILCLCHEGHAALNMWQRVQEMENSPMPDHERHPKTD